jgi:spore germination protein GerM
VQTLLGGLFVLTAVVAVSVGIWLRLTQPLKPPPPVIPPTVHLYVPRVNAQGELVYDSKPFSTSQQPDAYRAVFEQLLRETPIFPEGTRLLDAERQDDTLVLNFSAELVKNFEGGSDTEAALINALTRTASGFPGVQKVQILIEGKRVETLGGHLDISQPLPVQS